MLIVFVLVVIAAVVVFYGQFRWSAGTRQLRDRLEATRLPIEPQFFNQVELDGLPAPVQRYFRIVLQDGQPIVAAVTVEHTGTFNLGEATDQWKPFKSTQRVITQRPGFDWDGRVAILPGLSAHVHDAYVAGGGILEVAAIGLIPMIHLHGTGDIAQGELMRFFAEAAWYPTALLPSQGVRWEAVDDHSASATLRDGDLTLTLLFRFSNDGLIETVRTEARGRMVGKTVMPTPWHGRFSNYAMREGILVPLDGEVAWLLPEGEKPYWRGQITRISYEFAQELQIDA